MTAPARLSNAAIAKYAEKVGHNYRIYDDSGCADIDALRKQLGGRIEYADLPESSHVFRPGDFVIFIPNSTSMRRDRFTVAHELGHYFLHYLYANQTGQMIFNRGGRDRAETEANVFASALLMPGDAFRRAWADHEGRGWVVASVFDVSPAAAEVRAEVLGLS